MATGNDLNSFAEFLKSEPTGEFCAKPYYEATTDSLIFYMRDEPSFSKRLNQLLTVFVAFNDDSLVGIEIKGVRRMFRRIERFDGIEDDAVQLIRLLSHAMAPEPISEEAETFVSERIAPLKESARKVQIPRRELAPC